MLRWRRYKELSKSSQDNPENNHQSNSAISIFSKIKTTFKYNINWINEINSNRTKEEILEEESKIKEELQKK